MSVLTNILEIDTFYTILLWIKKQFLGGSVSVLGRHCCMDFSVVAESGGYAPVAVCGSSLQWLLLMQSWASVVAACGLSTYSSSCSRAQAQ